MLDLKSTKAKFPAAFKGKAEEPDQDDTGTGMADESDDDAYAEGDDSSPKAALTSALSALESAKSAVSAALKNCK